MEEKQRNLAMAEGIVWTTLGALTDVNCGSRSLGWSFLPACLAPWETAVGGKGVWVL